MIAIDVEASGIDYDMHSIVSVGTIDFADPTRQFYDECRIWDGAHIMEEALAVNEPSWARTSHLIVTL